MNKSFDGGQSGHYLPPISRNDSATISKARNCLLNKTDRSPINK